MLFRLVASTSIDDASCRHVVVSLKSKGKLGPLLEANGVKVFALHMNGALSVPFAFYRLWMLVLQSKPDLIQTWMVHSDLLGGLVGRLAGVRSVIWGVRTTDYSVEPLSTRLVRWVCARLSFVLPSRIVCAAHASLINSYEAGYAAGKLMVIHNGFNILELSKSLGAGQSIRQTVGIDPGTCVVGCLGRFNPAKDHANFVTAAALLACRFSHVRFLMVGRGLDAGNPELIKLIEATGFAERFVLLGERSDPAACLDAMDVFVLSSCTEGFPNVLGEAMAMGVPCVSTDVGDAELLMGSREWLVTARDSKALADKLTNLLSLPLEDRQRLGAYARSRMEQSFSMTATAQQFMTLYTNLIQTET